MGIWGSAEYIVALSVLLWLTAAASVAVVLVGSAQRGWRRRQLMRVGTVLLIASGPLASFLTLNLLGQSLFDAIGIVSSMIGIASFFVSIVLAILGSRLDRLWRSAKVAVVIPSRVPFFTEVRRGLKNSLVDQDVTVIDEYLAAAKPLEDLADFLSLLRSASAQRPDYLIVNTNSPVPLSSDEAVTIFRRVVSAGGGLVFIDNAPYPEALDRIGRERVRLIRSDFVKGSEILADYLQREYADYRVFLVVGPVESNPAMQRRRVFGERFDPIEIEDVTGWTVAGARIACERILARCSGHTLIVCGNDSMALGAVKAVRAQGRTDVVVAGYDGVREVIAAIAEPANPIVATLRTPASAYGEEAVAQILDMLEHRTQVATGEEGVVTLPVDSSHLITIENVDYLLAELWA